MKALKVFFALILFANNVSAQSAAGLIAHWPFNGNTNDSTGNGHTAVATAYNYAPGIAGKANTAFSFKDSLFMNVGYQHDLNLNKYSICAIVRLRTFSGSSNSSCFILRRLGTGIGPTGFAGSYYAALSDLFVTPGYSCLYGFANTNTAGATNKDFQYAPRTDTNRWYSMVVTYDSLTFRVYVNGLLKKTFTGPGIPLDTNSLGLCIGFSPGLSAPFGYFKGFMDDLRLYNRALADSEIIKYQYASKDTAVVLNTPFPDSVICQGGNTITANYLVSKTFRAGNVFTMQLSDSSGSFNIPANIGSATSVTSGSVIGTLPFLLPDGPHYRIRIIASNPVDTSMQYDVNIHPSVTPFVSVAVSPNDTVCHNDTVRFTVDSTLAAGVSPLFQWKKNGANITGATNKTYTSAALNDADTISCVMTSSHPCVHVSLESNKIIMSVNSVFPAAKLVATPSNIVPYGNTIVFSATLTNGGAAPQYQWKRNGQYISGATHDTLAYKNGVYGDRISVRIISSAFCAQPDSALSDTMTVIYTGSVSNVNEAGNMFVYPNPNEGNFILKGKATIGYPVNIEVLNTIGQIVYRRSFLPISSELNEPVSISNIPAGIYTLRVQTAGSVDNIRFTAK